MKIYIKIINGDLLRVKIPKASTIAHLKQQILTQLMEQDGEKFNLFASKKLIITGADRQLDKNTSIGWLRVGLSKNDPLHCLLQNRHSFVPSLCKNKMNNTVNYIWMGNLSTTNQTICCGLGPKSLATLAPHIKINMWVPETLMEDAMALFNDYHSITLLSVDRMLNRVYGKLRHIDHHVTAIKKGLRDMGITHSFAAQKDLVSFAIMAEYGGYFFDTTTRFIETPNLPPLSTLKVALPSWHRGEGGRKCEYAMPPWYGADVWAFASPKPGEPTFMQALALYLHDIRQWTGTTGRSQLALINALSYQYGEETDLAQVKALSWCASNTPVWGWDIKELKLQKIHAGLWRDTINSASYEELGLKISDDDTIRHPSNRI